MKLSKLCFRLNKIFPNVMSYYWVMYNHDNRSYKIIYKSKSSRKVIDASYWKNKDIYMYFLSIKMALIKKRQVLDLVI